MKKWPRGYDGAKKIVGRKRHILVDTEGRLIELFVYDADIQDPDGGMDVLEFARKEHPRLKKVWADARYQGGVVDWAKEKLNLAVVEVVRRLERQAGFVVIARRWVVDAPSHGWASSDGCPRTTRSRQIRAKPGSISQCLASTCVGWPVMSISQTHS